MSVQEVPGIRHRNVANEPKDEDSDIDTEAERPHPVEIIGVEEEHKFKLNHEALEEILCADEIRDKPVVVLSVAGAFRKGKSFLLDFFLRYLQAGQGGSAEKWLGSETEPLTGFSWRGGVERNTTGILMWSHPFVVRLPSDEEVAVILMDTQGAFDNQSTVKDCATIFALSTMIASVQVYNLSMMIQENDLQHLHLFTEYGRLAMQETKFTPFQSLCFLVRDWSYPYDHPYGEKGGGDFLSVVLKTSDNQHEEIQLVRKHIRSCFDTVSCFLLPHPGLKVATNPTFDGRLVDIDSDFKVYLRELVPFLLAPDNLVVKKINGSTITGRGLLECFKAYMKIFQSEHLPEPKSMLEATAEANNLSAQAAALDKYNKEMEDLCGADKPYLAPEKLKEQHEVIRMACLEQFMNVPKMGGDAFCNHYMKKLEEMIDESYSNYLKRNEGKHLVNAYRTPLVLVTVIVISYFLSTMLDLFGINSLSQTAVLGLYVPLVLILLWVYIRFTGSLREIGTFIDNIASAVWEQFIQPIYAKLLEKSLERALALGTRQLSNKKTN